MRASRHVRLKLPVALAFVALGAGAVFDLASCGPDESCAYVCVPQARDAGVDAASTGATGSSDCGEIVASPSECPADCRPVEDCGFG